MIKKYTILGLILCLPSSMLLAQTPPKSNWHTCPEIKQIIKDPETLIWHTKSGWHSHSPSFANHIKQFLGAQWTGINVGSVFCLYKTDGMDFKVIIQSPGLIKDPLQSQPANDKLSKWARVKGGKYENCVSNNQNACKFESESKQTPKDIYAIIGNLKSESANSIPSF